MELLEYLSSSGRPDFGVQAMPKLQELLELEYSPQLLSTRARILRCSFTDVSIYELPLHSDVGIETPMTA